MFYAISKALWPLVDPANFLGLLTVLMAVAMWRRWRRVATWTGAIAAAYILVLVTVPVGAYINWKLETRFPANPPLPQEVDGIIALGGPVDPVMTLAYDQPSVGGSFERVLVFAELAAAFPDARLIYSGGRHLTDDGPGEAAVLPRYFSQLGLAPERVILESDSRNTFQNAVNSLKLAAPGPEETWVLVTSAAHMPRAVGSFRQAGWTRELIAYPTDFHFLPGDRPRWFSFSLDGGLNKLRQALRETIGLAAYYWTGRSSELFPGPVTADIENAGQP